TGRSTSCRRTSARPSRHSCLPCSSTTKEPSLSSITNDRKAAIMRLDASKTAPEAYKSLRALQDYVDNCGIERRLIELVKVRTSQINGCAFCIVSHSHDARKFGETDDRLLLLDACRETVAFTERERAALAWTEAVTRITDGHVPDEVFAQARAQFSDRELVDLTYAVMMMNAWNRLAISFRKAPTTAPPAR